MARSATFIGFIAIAIISLIADRAAAEDEARARARMDEPFEITADRIVFDDARNLYVAEGHVRVDQLNRRMKARWLAFSTETRIGVAEGDVELLDGGDRLSAEFMVFDVDTLHGMLFQGGMASEDSGFHVRARELVRTGQNTFTVKDGAFSTCQCDPGERLPWEIRAQEADVELGGYGTIKNSTFNVLGVPVLWVPWAFFPVKSERETGFLLPSVAFGGRGGANVGLPFFWAALPQLNVTLTPHYFAERGYKQDLELEYVFGQRSEGRLFVSGLPNDLQRDPTSSFNRERWAVLWEHDQELPADWRWQTDLKLSSDNLYSDDFIEMRPFRTFRFIESTSNVARDFGSSGGIGMMLGARYADDAQGSTFRDRDQVLLQRFGEARADVQPGTFENPLGVDVRFDLEVIHFQSTRRVESELRTLLQAAPIISTGDGRFSDLGFDGRIGGPDASTEGDGIFQPGEPIIDRGTRMVLHPRVSRKFELGRFAEFVPEIGWQQTLYRTDAKRFAERGLLTARGEIRSRLARDYHRGHGGTSADRPNGWALRHVLEPRLGWAFVSQQRQIQNPRFVPRGTVDQSRLRSLSLESVTRDPSDRIDNMNQLVFALGQRFYVRDRTGRQARLRGELLTAVDWDFTKDGGLGLLYLEGRLFPGGRVSSHVRGAFDPESAHLEEGEIGLRIALPGVDRLIHRASLGSNYRFRRRLPRFAESVRGSDSIVETGDTKLNQFDWNARVELTERIRLSYRGTYSIANDSGLIRSQGRLDYVSKCRCWSIGVSIFEEREQGYGGGVEVRFLGLGDRKGSLFDSGVGFGQNFQSF